MKRSILIIAPFLPWPADFGGAARIYHLARELAREHTVTLVAPATAAEHAAVTTLGALCDVTAVPAVWTARQPAGRAKRLRQARSLGSQRAYLEVSGYDARMQAVIERLFLTRRIDLVQFELPQAALYPLPRSVPTVFNAQNIEHELLRRVARESTGLARRAFNLAEARKVAAVERRVWRAATVCVATSTGDAETISRLSGTPTRVVPNGVDAAFFGEARRDPAPAPLLVFTGAMRHAPNADGARWLIERVLPRVRLLVPGAQVAIVGADPPSDVLAMAATDVMVTGRVDDVRPWLGRAAVAVVPLRAGGGTRLKILEAFAAGVPVISTTLGAEGLDVADGEHLLLADTPDAFAVAVARVVRDPPLRARLSDAARALVAAHYDWTRIAPRLMAAHDLAVERFVRTSSSLTPRTEPNR